MADSAAAVKQQAEEPEPDVVEEDGDGDDAEEEEEEEVDASGSGAGSKKKRKKKKKKKGKGSGTNPSSSGAIAVPAPFQANLRIAPVAPPGPQSKKKGGAAHPCPGPNEAPTGRAALAARDLKPGELVFEEAPVVLSVFHKGASKPRCGYCGRDRPRSASSASPADEDGGEGGVIPIPCSPSCRDGRLAAAYRLAAPALALVGDVAREADCEAQLLTLLVVLACLKHLHATEPGAEEGQGGGKWCAGWGGVAALMDHRERMAPAFLAAVGAAVGKLWPELPAAVRAGVAEEEGVRLACVVNVNRWVVGWRLVDLGGVYTFGPATRARVKGIHLTPLLPPSPTNSHGCTAPEATNSTIGVGLFPLLAMLNHSCSPNCAFIFLDGAVGVRALRPIAAVRPCGCVCVHVIRLDEIKPIKLNTPLPHPKKKTGRGADGDLPQSPPSPARPAAHPPRDQALPLPLPPLRRPAAHRRVFGRGLLRQVRGEGHAPFAGGAGGGGVAAGGGGWGGGCEG